LVGPVLRRRAACFGRDGVAAVAARDSWGVFAAKVMGVGNYGGAGKMRMRGHARSEVWLGVRVRDCDCSTAALPCADLSAACKMRH
jgi:hypothetical protein